MKIGSLGFVFPTTDVDYIPFKSSDSCFEYDIILYNMSEVYQEYYGESPSFYEGYPLVPIHSSPHLLEDRNRRMKELFEIAGSNKKLIIQMPTDVKCYYHTGNKEFSGTGRSQKTTVLVNPLDSSFLLPFKTKSTLVNGSGKILKSVVRNHVVPFIIR